MDMARVIGTIVATSKVASLEGTKLCVIQPLDENYKSVGQVLVATDATSRRGTGELVYFVASGDAMFTGLDGEDLPVDAAIIGIIDSMHIAKP